MIFEKRYKEIIETKNGTNIPIFFDGKSVESRYNPQRDAENIINNIENKYSFFIVLGIASGILISKLFERFPESKIIGIETSDDDLIFLNQLESIKKLIDNNNIILTTIKDLEIAIINNYIPALYGDLKIIEQRGWVDENKDYIKEINDKINHSIGIISADFSVQSHFGKIWQSNIINNLKNISNYSSIKYDKIDNSKTAIVVAAGPSLDSTIKTINKNEDFLISTDTAYSILQKYNIIPNIVISIDGQFVSHNHFTEKVTKKTLFLLDLCSNYTIGNNISKKTDNLIYFVSGHPLSALSNHISDNKFLSLYSGAGTVTITAIDLAIQLGFKNIKLLGADFSYINGKAYSKGSYFDKIFSTNETKILPLESQFEKLMFRTELNKIGKNTFTTKILSAYKTSLEDYLQENNCKYEIDNNTYIIKNNSHHPTKNYLRSFKYDYNHFVDTINKCDLADLTIPLLPYVAWLRNNKLYKNDDIKSLLKLAQSHIVRYN